MKGLFKKQLEVAVEEEDEEEEDERGGKLEGPGARPLLPGHGAIMRRDHHRERAPPSQVHSLQTMFSTTCNYSGILVGCGREREGREGGRERWGEGERERGGTGDQREAAQGEAQGTSCQPQSQSSG